VALDTFANLKASIINWSKRNNLTDLLVEDFIRLAEVEMYANPVKTLDIRGMETRSQANVTTTSRFLALPDNFLEMRGLNLNLTVDGSEDNYVDLIYRTQEQLKVYEGPAVPAFFTVNSQIEMDVTPDQAYPLEMHYFEKPTPLSDSNTTNEVLTNNPNIYLFGSLWALHNYFRNEQEAAYYYDLFISAIRGEVKKDTRGRYGPAPVIRVEGVTP